MGGVQADLCTYCSLTPRSWVPVVRPWEGGFLCFALLCGLLGLEIGVNLPKDAFWQVAEAGLLMAWVPRYPLPLICE